MSRIEDRIDVIAEINACERIWALDEARLDLELIRAGVEPKGLVQRLEGGLGLKQRPTPGITQSLQREGLEKAPIADGGAPHLQPATSASMSSAASASAPLETIELAGRIKFFDAAKGFGFFVADNGRGDVMVHVSRLQAVGVRSVYEGTRIHAIVHLTSKGLQALHILSVDQGEAVHPSQIEPRTREKVQPESAWVRAVVKWYNATQGYGFVCESAGSPDCFVHADTLRRWGMAPLVPGQVVEVRWGAASRGRMVAEIRHPDGASALPPVH